MLVVVALIYNRWDIVILVVALYCTYIPGWLYIYICIIEGSIHLYNLIKKIFIVAYHAFSNSFNAVIDPKGSTQVAR